MSDENLEPTSSGLVAKVTPAEISALPGAEVEPERAVVLGDGEHLVGATEELLYRQITKHQLGRDGQLGSHAFGPVDADHGKASYSRASPTTPQASRDWHTEHARSPSLAVWAVTAAEVVKSKTFAIDDSAAPLVDGHPRAPGHCFVDYRDMANAQIKNVRAILLRYALQRGETPTSAPTNGLLELPAAE